MILEMKPHREEKQGLLDFSNAKQKPESFKLKGTNHVIYVDYDGFHHVVEGDMNVYQIKRKSKPRIAIISHESHNQRYQYFVKEGFLV
jgi:hypothetical protein